MDVWINFEGTREIADEYSILRPANDRKVAIAFADADVRESNGRVEIRKGAYWLSIEVSPFSLLRLRPTATRVRRECNNNLTTCIGATEFCCNSGKVLGKCTGYWKCP